MTPPPTTPLKPPTPAVNRIGRFHILRELGRGAIGSVYLGHDPVIDREIAVKTFNPKLSSAERKKYEQQFINEARAAGRLSHPNIVTIYDASSEGGTTFIAMEYMKGRELSRMLGNGHQFEINDVAAIIWKIADALDYAHKNGVIHRDIKPANIFILDDLQPKLVDFGIARSPNRVADQLAKPNDAPYTLFHNNLLGTPTYMSPEQAANKQVDSRTDIYSLGAVMYEMLTGRRPFQSSDTDKLLQMIAHKAPKQPHDVNPDIPESLSQIVMLAMSKRPEKRYATGTEMANDIKRYLVKGKRMRKELKLPIEASIQSAPTLPFYKRKLFWMSCLAFTGAFATVGVKYFR